MQVIEYGKECVLRSLCTVEELYVIDDQHVHQLIKMNEIIDGIVPAVINKLIDKLLGTHV